MAMHSQTLEELLASLASPPPQEPKVEEKGVMSKVNYVSGTAINATLGLVPGIAKALLRAGTSIALDTACAVAKVIIAVRE